MSETLSDPVTPEPIRIGIIEDNAYLRAAWRSFLSQTPDMEIVATCESVEQALSHMDKLERCQVLLMDVGLPGMSGIEGTRKVTELLPDLAVVMVTVHDDDQHVFEALCAGAVGYLVKNVAPEELVEGIRAAVRGGAPMTPNVARRVIQSFRKRPPPPPESEALPELTDKERGVLEHLSRGASYSEVGKSLFLSVDGVRYHIRHVYEKLHVHSRAEAVAKGLRHSIIKPPW